MAAPTDKLHDIAMSVEDGLEQLATGIASLGDDQAAAGITKMASIIRQVATGLAKNMHAEEPPPTTDDAIAAHMEQRRAAGPPA